MDAINAMLPGMIIKTNYSEQLHQIKRIVTGYTCPRYTDELGYTNTGMNLESPEHIHLVCRDLSDGGESYFGGYKIINDKNKKHMAEGR